jgi:hypothetical protein
MPRNTRLALVGAILMTSAVAIAGKTYSNASSDTEVVTFSGGGWFRGSIGAVRNSPDNLQYLGCWVRITSGGELGGCYARDAASAYASCTTTNWRLIDAIHSISDSARLLVSWDAGFNCTEVEVRAASTEEPRQL